MLILYNINTWKVRSPKNSAKMLKNTHQNSPNTVDRSEKNILQICGVVTVSKSSYAIIYNFTHNLLKKSHKENNLLILQFFISLLKAWSFPLRISSVNVTKSQVTTDLVTFTEEILDGKLYVLQHALCDAW